MKKLLMIISACAILSIQVNAQIRAISDTIQPQSLQAATQSYYDYPILNYLSGNTYIPYDGGTFTYSGEVNSMSPMHISSVYSELSSFFSQQGFYAKNFTTIYNYYFSFDVEYPFNDSGGEKTISTDMFGTYISITQEYRDPGLFDVTGGGYTPATVGLNSSEPGVLYTLYCNNVAVGTDYQKIGTGSAINFTNITKPGKYTIRSTTRLMAGYAEVMYPDFTKFEVIRTVPAIGEEFTVSGEMHPQMVKTASQLQTTLSSSFSYYKVAVSNTTVSGLNFTTTLTVPPNDSGWDKLIYLTGKGWYVMITQYTLSIQDYILTGGGIAPASVTLNSSQPDVIYTLLIDGVAQGAAFQKQGTGSAITFSDITTKGSCTVKATFKSLTKIMTGSPVVTIPYLNQVSIPQHIDGGGGTIACSGTVNPYSELDTDAKILQRLKTVFDPHNVAVSNVVKTGYNFSFNLTFQINTTNADKTISSSVLGPQILITQRAIELLENIQITGVGLAPGSLTLSTSQLGVNYQLFLDGGFCSFYPNHSYTGTGSSITFSNLTMPGFYTVKAFVGYNVKFYGGVTVFASSLELPESENYIAIYKPREEKTKGDVLNSTNSIVDINYYDGLGRISQKVSLGASSANGKNIITPLVYDILGRNVKDYLPFASEGNFIASAASTQEAYYSNLFNSTEAKYAYAENAYESSPFNREKERINVGNIFRTNNKKASIVRDLNTAADKVFKMYYANSRRSLFTESDYYPAGKLFKETITNEDGQSKIIFTDVSGKKILERSISGEVTNPDIYYVYGQTDKLNMVISPEGSKSLALGKEYADDNPLILKYGYLYGYDNMGQKYAKRIPGSDLMEYSVYDFSNRLVASSISGGWLLYQYDSFSQMIKCKKLEGTYSYETMAANWSTLLNSGTEIKVFEYDSYQNHSLSFANIAQFALPAAKTNVKGQKTYEKLAILDGNGNIERAFYYDKNNRIIQVVMKNHLGFISRFSYQYDFIGNILAIHEEHNVSATQKHSITTTNTYDSRSRLLSTSTVFDSNPASRITYVYNELGQLAEQIYGTTPELKSTLTYNIQGWLTGLSSSRNKYSLKYYDPVAGTPSYTGNISEKHWGQTSSRYTYNYDKLNRLISATGTYPDGMAQDYYTEKGISYDLNGNMLTLQRMSRSNLENNFTYTYDGNRLTALGGTHPANYEYYETGNLKKDSRKNLYFEYNHLNLMNNVKTGNVNGAVKAKYLYSADGTKLQARNGNSTSGYDYLGSLILVTNNGNVSAECHFNEGYIKDNMVYYYQRDHLGSPQFVLNNNNQPEENIGYYPFGKPHPDGVISATNRAKFNGKETQEAFGMDLLDYGFRMYDPEIARWFVPDPLADKYYSTSPYAYALNNPVNAIDPDGKLVIFVNGFHHGFGAGSQYWKGFDDAVMKHLGDNNSIYYDGSLGGVMGVHRRGVHRSLISIFGPRVTNIDPHTRYLAGYIAGKEDVSLILNQLTEGETIKVISHSMGAAYAKGLIKALIDEGVDPSLFAFEADFAPFQPKLQKAVDGIDTFQFSHSDDKIAGLNPMFGALQMNTENDTKQGHSISYFMDQINALPNGKYKIENGKIVPY